MSGDLYAEPGIVNKVYCDQDDKDNMVNIYVSAESLRVYDNPWVESRSPITPGPAEIQHPVISDSGKRNRVRMDLVLLGLVCLLLLVAIICLGVYMNKDKASWRRERNQLLAVKDGLENRSHQLIANITKLNRENKELWEWFCGCVRPNKKPRKCKNLDQF